MASARAKGAGISSSCGSPSRLAEEFKECGCKSPIQRFQRFYEEIIEVVTDPAELWDQLVSRQFFAKGEKERSEALHQRQAANHKEKTDVEKLRFILLLVLEKTEKLPDGTRYDTNSPLVIFIYALSSCESGVYMEMAQKLRNAITTSHDCEQHSATSDATAAVASRNMSVDEIEALSKDNEEFDELILSTMRGLKDQADGVDVKQITRRMQGVDIATAACNSGIKKSVNRALDQRLTKRSLVKKNGKKHGNFECFELSEGSESK